MDIHTFSAHERRRAGPARPFGLSCARPAAALAQPLRRPSSPRPLPFPFPPPSSVRTLIMYLNGADFLHLSQSPVLPPARNVNFDLQKSGAVRFAGRRQRMHVLPMAARPGVCGSFAAVCPARRRSRRAGAVTRSQVQS